MEKQTLRDMLAETLGGTEVQRGIKLGTLAACLAMFILFSAGALLRQSSTTVDLDRGQFAPLVIGYIVGLLALFVGMLLAYYSGLIAPEAKSGDAGRAGLLSGAITMVLFWVGQTTYGVVSAAQAPAGVQLNDFLKRAFIYGLTFFVFGGLFGWWGARAAARRARSILSPSTGTTLSLLDSSAPVTPASLQTSKPESASASELGEEPG